MERVKLQSCLFIATLLVMSSSCVLGYNVPSIFIFGDSLLDAGSNRFKKNCTIQADFPPYGITYFHYPTGRFADGRIVTDFISEFVGLPLQNPYPHDVAINGTWKEYASSGINFASGGSGVLPATNQKYGVTPILEQVQQMRTLLQEKHISKKQIQESLIIFTSGSNDMFGYFIPSNGIKLTPNRYIQAMLTEVQSFVDQIYKLGARRIALISLGPVGCIPARILLSDGLTHRCLGIVNRMIKRFNARLERVVKEIPVKYPGLFAVYGDIYDSTQDFRANPKRYGFSDANAACCGAGTIRGELQCGTEGYELCANPNEYLFWDYFHPSEFANKLYSELLWTGNHSEIRPVNLKTLANMTLIQL